MTDHVDAYSHELQRSAEPADAVVVDGETTDGEAVEETVDGLPVLVEARPLATGGLSALPAVQTAAAAATGFVVGAATLALVRRHTARKIARSRPAPPRRAVDLLPVVGSRTFIVDVHLLAKPEE